MVGLVWMMTLALAGGAAPGGADDFVAHATAVVEGTVSSITDCGQDGRTFIEIKLDNVLHGKVSDGNSKSVDTVSFGLPYGVHADGTFSMTGGIPAFAKGESVIVGLRSHDDGDPSWQPLPFRAYSVLRTVDVPKHGLAVIDGEGRPLVFSEGEVFFGSALDSAVMTIGAQQFADTGAVADALTKYLNDPAYWNGEGAPPDGPLYGGVRIDADGDYITSCDAALEGTQSKGEVYLYGSCNANYVGAVDLEVEGTITSKGWSGTLTATAPAIPGASEAVTLTSSVFSYEHLHLVASDVTSYKGVKEGWSVELGIVPDVLPRLATVEEAQAWLDAGLSAQADTYGLFTSTPLTKTSCATTPAYVSYKK